MRARFWDYVEEEDVVLALAKLACSLLAEQRESEKERQLERVTTATIKHLE